MAEKKAERIAVVDRELCKPEKCQLICQRSCPIVRSGEECIVYSTDEKGKKKIKPESRTGRLKPHSKPVYCLSDSGLE